MEIGKIIEASNWPGVIIFSTLLLYELFKKNKSHFPATLYLLFLSVNVTRIFNLGFWLLKITSLIFIISFPVYLFSFFKKRIDAINKGDVKAMREMANNCHD